MTIGIGAVLAMLSITGPAGHLFADVLHAGGCHGLYWHFVDTVWIFLLPMLYLLARIPFAANQGVSPWGRANDCTATTYVIVCVALVLLTVLTVGVSFGRFRGLALVDRAGHRGVQGEPGGVVFHARLDSPRLTWIVIAVACFWLGLLFALSMNDYTTRDLVPFMPGH